MPLSIGAGPVYIPTNSVVFLFLHILTMTFSGLFDMAVLTGVRWYLIGDLTRISPKTSDDEHFYVPVGYLLSLDKSLFSSCIHFSAGLFSSC